MKRRWKKPAAYVTMGIIAGAIAGQAHALSIRGNFAFPGNNTPVSQAIVPTPIYQNTTSPPSINNTGPTLVTGGGGGVLVTAGGGPVVVNPEPSALLLLGSGLLGIGWQLRKRAR
jgi:hypothetical protein